MNPSRWVIGGLVAAGAFVACGGSIENAATFDPPEASPPSLPPSTPSSAPSAPPSPPAKCNGTCFVGGTAVCAAGWALAPGKCTQGWECCEPQPGAPAPTPPPEGSLLCWDDGPYPAGTCFGYPCSAVSVCEYTEPDSKGRSMPSCSGITRLADDTNHPPKGTCFIANCGTIHCKSRMICTDPVKGVCG